MAEEWVLTAAPRGGRNTRTIGTKEAWQTARQLRRAGGIPAVVYGRDIPTRSLVVEAKQFARILHRVSSSTLVSLVIGSDDRRPVLIQNVQRHPLTGDPLHIDFHQVQLTERIQARVPLVHVGMSPAVKDLGGTLFQSLVDIEVEALPQQLPKDIAVDLARLTTCADRLTVADLTVPPGVTIRTNPHDIVAVVTPPRTEAELKELESAPEEKAAEVKTEAEEKKAAEATKKAEEGRQQETKQ